ncbi:MAG TPA: hypothetical protein ENK54_04520 [Thiotrichales bacterium]|nr:hypothetical protein [Thiotrichales bacterium]
MIQNNVKALITAFAAALILGLGFNGIARADSSKSNPFAVADAPAKLVVAAADGKCGAGKCGGKMMEGAKDGKCGAGKCGGKMKEGAKAMKDGKCGGKMKEGAKPMKEGKCGAGKCGAGKCGGKM